MAGNGALLTRQEMSSCYMSQDFANTLTIVTEHQTEDAVDASGLRAARSRTCQQSSV